MKIQIVSYIYGLSDEIRLDLTTEIINNSHADLLLFSGNTIGSENDIKHLQSTITNNMIEVIFELRAEDSSNSGNRIFHIKDGKIHDLNTHQLFAQSSDIENDNEFTDKFIHELEEKRRIKIKGYSVLIIQCGEINILKNIQSENNRVEFRLRQNKELNNRFIKLLSDSDIILNPIHTPMGNQGKLKKRREFLTQNNKYYFSASNTNEVPNKLSLKSLQYAYYNKTALEEIDSIVEKNYISRIYETAPTCG